MFTSGLPIKSVLTSDWLSQRVRIPLELRKLAVVRPTTLDLILTKMARGDENDLADVRFLLQQDAISAEQIRAASARARVPDGPEIQELFRATQPKMLAPAGAC